MSLRSRMKKSAAVLGCTLATSAVALAVEPTANNLISLDCLFELNRLFLSNMVSILNLLLSSDRPLSYCGVAYVGMCEEARAPEREKSKETRESVSAFRESKHLFLDIRNNKHFAHIHEAIRPNRRRKNRPANLYAFYCYSFTRRKLTHWYLKQLNHILESNR